MVAARIGRFVGVAGILSVFGGCQMVGPIAIDAGRDRYNSIIQSTTKQQAFANIIRVHNNEPTSFMDVTEVDATQTFTGTLSGTASGIGSKPGTYGTLGSVSPGVSYSEAPLIRYVPLVGQGLVEQLVAPVNTGALASLYDSDWGVMPLLDLSAAFLTLDYDEFGAAINLIAELDNDDRLELASTKSDWTKPKNASGKASDKQDNTGSGNKKTSTSANTDDALVIYLLPFHPHHHDQMTRSEEKECEHEQMLWQLLVRLYKGTQAPNKAGAKAADAPARAAADKIAAERKAAAGGGTAPATPAPTPNAPPQPAKSKNCTLADSIELRTMPVTKKPSPLFISDSPLMRTYSALGILKNAAQPPTPRIGFVPPDVYQRIISYLWNDPEHENARLSVYTLLPDDQGKNDEPLSPENQDERRKFNPVIVDWLNTTELPLPYVYLPKRGGINDDAFVMANHRLEQLRRYILIIKSDTLPPANAYVAYFDRGHWYYIDGEDQISQKNFNLIVLFLTVMAYPPTTVPLTTSINVGG